MYNEKINGLKDIPFHVFIVESFAGVVFLLFGSWLLQGTDFADGMKWRDFGAIIISVFGLYIMKIAFDMLDWYCKDNRGN